MRKRKAGHRASPEANSELEAYRKVIQILRSSKKILVVTGAGISVSCGIPDFRSKEVGLYSSSEVASVMESAGGSAEELFDIDFFRDNPQPFYQFAYKVSPGLHCPSLTHFFVALLARKKKLLRNFTQNIDGLEHIAGLPESRWVPCHGSMTTSKCLKCRRIVPYSELLSDIQRRVVPTCDRELKTKSKTRICGGVFKPCITFFGEAIPTKSTRMIEADVEKADALIIIGTSLQVRPVSSIPVRVRQDIPQILINRTTVQLSKSFGHGGFDFELLGDCDDIVRKVCEDLGWELDGMVEEWSHRNPTMNLNQASPPSPSFEIEMREEGPRALRFSKVPRSLLRRKEPGKKAKRLPRVHK